MDSMAASAPGAERLREHEERVDRAIAHRMAHDLEDKGASPLSPVAPGAPGLQGLGQVSRAAHPVHHPAASSGTHTECPSMACQHKGLIHETQASWTRSSTTP